MTGTARIDSLTSLRRMPASAKTVAAILSALVLGLVGCDQKKGDAPGSQQTQTQRTTDACDSLNEKDLESSAKCYHLGEPPDPWSFLSKESQLEEGNRDTFNAGRITARKGAPGAAIWPPRSLRVLGIDTRGASVFGRVEAVSERAPAANRPPCQTVNTYSWIQEGGAWRRVRLPKTQELFSRQFLNGDYSGAVATAEKWLSLDPFSPNAYRQLVFALARRGGGSQTSRSVADAVRAVLAVNPVDSTSLFTAVSNTSDIDIAEALFDKMAADDCWRNGAAFNLSNEMAPKRRMAFLERIGPVSPSIRMQTIRTAHDLRDRKRLSVLLSSDSDKEVRSELDLADASYAATWGTAMGEAWLFMGNKEAAKAWATYAATRDPNHPEVASLLRRVKR